MAKARTHFVCRACGGVQTRWMGKCPDCGAWDGLERFVEPKAVAGAASAGAGLADAWRLADHEESDKSGSVMLASPKALPLPMIEASDHPRLPSGLSELDRVLGGGFVPGSVVLLGGDPGIGKSTILLQSAAALAAEGRRVLYVSSEESAFQTRLRAERLFPESARRGGGGGQGADGDAGGYGRGDAGGAPDVAALGNLYVLADTELGRIVEQARQIRPDLLVIDSIQLVYKSDVPGAPGSVAQVRRCCTELVCLAKVATMTVALVGHVTKDGQIAGPRLLEHLVDVVLSFEGDRHHAHRVVRGIKNRFGTTLEVGLFSMGERGLEEVDVLSRGLDPHAPSRPGTVVAPILHGTRCIPVEIQALVAPTFPGAARRRVSGLDANRLAMAIAVLEQHADIRLSDQDVFASAVGGLRVIEPAADLAMCLAIAGAFLRKAVGTATAVIGEVGLGGEIRPVQRMEQRIGESLRLGFRRLLVPVDALSAELPKAAKGKGRSAAELIGVRDITAAMACVHGGESHSRAGSRGD